MRDCLATRVRRSGHALGSSRDRSQCQRWLPHRSAACRAGRVATGSGPTFGVTRCPQLAHGSSRRRLWQPPQPDARPGRRLSLAGPVAGPAPTRPRPDSPSGGTLPQLLRPVRSHRPPVGSLRQTIPRLDSISRLSYLPSLRFCPVVLSLVFVSPSALEVDRSGQEWTGKDISGPIQPRHRPAQAFGRQMRITFGHLNRGVPQ